MPNKRVNGWDERDYKLWSKLQQLASYGIIQPDDRMISRDDVVKLLECESEERFRAAHVQSREKEPK